MISFILCDDNEEFTKNMKNVISKVMMPLDTEYKIFEFNRYNLKMENLINSDEIFKIYILDIKMPGLSGIDIARKIREKDWKSIILFLTVHEEKQNEIFKSRLMVLDFINKGDNNYKERLEACIKTSIDISKADDKILTFKFKNIVYKINYNEIIYIEKELSGKKCMIHTENGKKYHMVSTLQELSEKLGGSFCKCHRACLVNLDKIISVDVSKNIIYFVGGYKLNLISKEHKKELMDYVANY